MKVNKYICDKCFVTQDAESTPEGWNELRVGYNNPKSYDGRSIRTYHFCPECSRILSIETVKSEPTKSTADHLVEILSEIARSATQR